jgi:hypothetical protein
MLGLAAEQMAVLEKVAMAVMGFQTVSQERQYFMAAEAAAAVAGMFQKRGALVVQAAAVQVELEQPMRQGPLAQPILGAVAVAVVIMLVRMPMQVDQA